MCSDKKRKAEIYTKFKIKHLAITASSLYSKKTKQMF